MKNLTDQEKVAFLNKKLDEFKSFITDSIADGHLDEIDDHYEFLKASLEVFCDLDAHYTEDEIKE